MSCPFCEVFTCYQRQVARRLETGTFAMSEDNAHLLVCMAAQIRNITRTTLRLVSHEAVPTLLCDLLDGLADGLIEEFDRKLASPFRKNGHSTPLAAAPPILDGEPNIWEAP